MARRHAVNAPWAPQTGRGLSASGPRGASAAAAPDEPDEAPPWPDEEPTRPALGKRK